MAAPSDPPAPAGEAGFVRFVGYRGPGQGRIGFFTLAQAALDGHWLPPTQHAELAELIDWFAHHMLDPAAIIGHPALLAQSWFRTDTPACVDRCRHVALLLSLTGCEIAELVTDRPGHVIYEDGLQVVAVPYAATPR